MRFYRLLSFILLCVPLLIATAHATSWTVNVEVLDNDRAPLEGVIVSATPTMMSKPGTEPATHIMDQVDRQFAPHFLVIQKNDLVRFPNSDSIKHHVYSFSKPKQFQLLLDKGSSVAPMQFGRSGVVELGCNVHDWMLGYIYVVDTPFYTGTDSAGKSQLSLPPDTYTIKIWHPRFQEPESVLVKTVSPKDSVAVSFHLTQPLLPDLSEYENEAEFYGYE